VPSFFASAQPPTPPIPENAGPTIQVYSRETIVDVLVTNAKGQPVRGLQQSDFTISEDGHPQPIRSFAEFGSDYAPPPPPLPHLPPNVYTNYQATPATGPVNILLIDALHSHPVDVVHALRGAERYIVAMPSGTQVAIFWLSVSGLHMLQGFTTDPALLLRAVRTNRVDIGADGDDRYSIDKFTWTALNQIASYVQPIKGRKNLLWIAPGAPILLFRDGGYAWHDDDMTRVHHIMDTYELFTAEQIAVSPVDPRGVTRLGMAQLAAEEIAAGTGGEAFYENNDLKTLIAQAIHDGSHFYTLSYIPPRQKLDGHYHSIKVQTTLPGLHLVYRAGYNSEDPPQLPQHSGADLMKAAIKGNAPAAMQLLFDVQATPANPVGQSALREPPKKASAPYEVLYFVPQRQIAFNVSPNGTHNGAVQFDVAAYDIYGRLVASQSHTLNLPLAANEYRQFLETPFQFSQVLDLPPGQISLRIGVLDITSNKVGSLEIPLNVPSKPRKLAPAPPAVTPAIIPAATPVPCPPRCPLPPPAQ
jgi:VWFA-related protein